MSSDLVEGTSGNEHSLQRHSQPVHVSAPCTIDSYIARAIELVLYKVIPTRLLPCMCELPLPRMLMLNKWNGWQVYHLDGTACYFVMMRCRMQESPRLKHSQEECLLSGRNYLTNRHLGETAQLNAESA